MIRTIHITVPEDLYEEIRGAADHLEISMQGLLIIGALRYAKAQGLYEGPIPNRAQFKPQNRASQKRAELLELLSHNPQGLTEKELCRQLQIGRTALRTLVSRVKGIEIDETRRPMRFRLV